MDFNLYALHLCCKIKYRDKFQIAKFVRKWYTFCSLAKHELFSMRNLSESNHLPENWEVTMRNVNCSTIHLSLVVFHTLNGNTITCAGNSICWSNSVHYTMVITEQFQSRNCRLHVKSDSHGFNAIDGVQCTQ